MLQTEDSDRVPKVKNLKVPGNAVYDSRESKRFIIP